MKRFCGRDFSGREMRRLCELIGEDPTRSRAQLSRLACQLLGWFKPDGGLKEMSCRVAMLRMHRQGLLQLPPPRNPKGGSGPIKHTFCSAPQPLLSRPVHELSGLHLSPSRSRAEDWLIGKQTSVWSISTHRRILFQIGQMKNSCVTAGRAAPTVE